MTGLFLHAFIYLAAAVITVPIAKRLGLGSVLGYLIAGLIIGPIFGLVGDEAMAIQHFAEFGVVMMMFLVGLELNPKMLWAMRNRLLGVGGLQLLLTALCVMAIALSFNQTWQESLAIGLILALSSTAIVLQTFNEKALMKTEGGKNAFSVLLFQDIAVIPILALLPLLAIPEIAQLATEPSPHKELSLVAGLPTWAVGLIVPGAVLGVVIGGHYLSRPLFTFVARSGLREIFTATALMLVIGISALMSLVGLSPALGTFLAGVVLANSEFRHELESNIEPFKGLLLGLFFITVGAGIDINMLEKDLFLILSLAIGLMVLKTLILLFISLVFRIKKSAKWLFSLSLAQAGEFGFVLLSFSKQTHVLPNESVQILLLVVSLSMFFTPALFIFYEKFILPHFEKHTNNTEEDTDVIDEKTPVIIAGVGRFGQVVNRLLTANGIETVVLDHQATQVENLRHFNIKSYFGDATRPDLLHTAGIDQTKLLIVAIDNPKSSIDLVEYVKKTYPQVIIIARAYDRDHSYKLWDAGADTVIKETFHSALEMGAEALRALNIHPFAVEQKKATFLEIEHSNNSLLYKSWEEGDESRAYDEHFFSLFIQVEAAMRNAMEGDRLDKHSMTEREWTPPPKNYLDVLEEQARASSSNPSEAQPIIEVHKKQDE